MTVFDALATVRDVVVAYDEYTKKPICVITLNFSSAFDNIIHDYLIMTLHHYGFSDRMIRRIMNLYDNATSMVQINGYVTKPIPIRSSIRQGCPLSMYLFAVCLPTPLNSIHATLPGITIDRNRRKTVVTASAGDITIYVTSPADISHLDEILSRYERASGSKINKSKSKVMALGTWNKSVDVLGM
jgi:hypothetical protein